MLDRRRLRVDGAKVVRVLELLDLDRANKAIMIRWISSPKLAFSAFLTAFNCLLLTFPAAVVVWRFFERDSSTSSPSTSSSSSSPSSAPAVADGRWT